MFIVYATLQFKFLFQVDSVQETDQTQTLTLSSAKPEPIPGPAHTLPAAAQGSASTVLGSISELSQIIQNTVASSTSSQQVCSAILIPKSLIFSNFDGRYLA